ncbi:hypothetical protein LS71_000715 [Helicobacter jaachi]|uniref:Uncharacterized protein n=1 Tax=Helicobacter jaachi TaxID=1677920 RepID=A0A4V6I2S7_9HELI|nr:hypothetical protein [Helicobacter jaachi]TLD97312.1 hypothetical protein LS71_000715 [Helicobacter jaachi]
MFYSDPLFGIIILVSIIALAALIDYWRNRYKDKQKERSLKNLAKSYEFVGLTQGVEEFLALSHNPIPTLQFIANAYIQSGNTQEAIKIYLSILENLKHTKESAKSRIEILQNLGTAYYTAGFLQRAKNIFLEILKNYPKNPQVLIYLLKTYESLNEYKNAINALECIEEIYDSEMSATMAQERFFNAISLNKAYLSTLLLINHHAMQLSTKIQKLNDIKAKEPRLEKIILQYFKDVNRSLFWEEIEKSKRIAGMIDILWHFERESVPLDSITNPQILDVYRAKGWINDNQSCKIFALENMRILKQYSHIQVDLDFEYRCHSCKHIFPFENARCSNCGELLNTDVLCKIRNIADEASYPLL